MKKKSLKNSRFNLENAINIYASSFYLLPAEDLYDKKKLDTYKEIIDKCHIYIIGFIPVLEIIEANQIHENVVLRIKVDKSIHELTIPIPNGYHFVKNTESCFFCKDQNGSKHWYSDNTIANMICKESDIIKFHVKYIGQAYGKNGSRNAIDRLLNHEKLQKISLKGIPEGQTLSLLLLEIQPKNRIYTIMYKPHAQSNQNNNQQIQNGLDKLYGTDDKERISLYEASLIHYFSPSYNKEFKNSFPSTNLKILQDCYDKDFSAVIAEICFDDLPFLLCSDNVPPKLYHSVKYNLHEDDDRKSFFYNQ